MKVLLEKALVPAEGKQPPACFTMVETDDDVQQTSEPNSWRTHPGPARKSSSVPLVLLSFLRRHHLLGAAHHYGPGGPWSADT